MFGKIEIKGKIKVKTGMHIGASEAFAAIGAIDSPVVRDKISNLPIIPGSSLKGKIRSLLAKKYNDKFLCEHDNDDEKILRLFGSSNNKKTGNPQSSRLIFSDMMLDNMDELKAAGLDMPTEAKEENSINRITAVANPRQIERVINGTVFGLDIIYDVFNEDEIAEDLSLLFEGMKLLQYDYIGGHGSRGYGRIEFSEMDIDVVLGEVNGEILTKCRELLKEV